MNLAFPDPSTHATKIEHKSGDKETIPRGRVERNLRCHDMYVQHASGFACGFAR